MTILPPKNIYFLLFFILACAVTVFLNEFHYLNANPLLPLAVSLDFSITIPLTFYFFNRNNNVSIKSIAIVFAVSISVAEFLLPIEHTTYISFAKYILLPIEGFIFYSLYNSLKKFKKIQTKVSKEALPLNQHIFKLLNTQINNTKLSHILTSEFMMAYYIFSKNLKEADNFFTIHKRSGLSATLFIAITLVLVETSVLHIVLSDWNNYIAWILSTLSLYTVLYIIAERRYSINNGVSVNNDSIRIINGMVWNLQARVSSINRIETCYSDISIEHHLKLPLLTPVNCIIYFNKFITVNGIYGMKRKVKSVSLFIDERDAFIRTINNEQH